MSRLTDVVSDGRGGVFATSLPKDDLGDGLTQPGLVFLDIDGSQLRTATQFLAALGEQLKVPDLAEAEDWDYLDECLVDLDEFPRPDRSSYCSISSSIWQELSRPNGKRFLVCLATPSRRAETVKNRCSSSCAENRRPPVFLLPISPKAPIGIDRTEFLDQARSSYRGVLALALAALAKRWALRRRHKTIPPMPAAIRIRAAASGRSSIGDHGDRPIAQTVKLLGVVVH